MKLNNPVCTNCNDSIDNCQCEYSCSAASLKPEITLKSSSQLLDSISASHNKQFKIVQKKNADYSRGENEFRNFETVYAVLPWITTEEGIIIRMLDKLTRLANLAHHGNAYVTEESFEDTCDDIANYANILKAYRQYKKVAVPEEVKEQDEPIFIQVERGLLNPSVLDWWDNLSPKAKCIVADKYHSHAKLAMPFEHYVTRYYEQIFPTSMAQGQ